MQILLSFSTFKINLNIQLIPIKITLFFYLQNQITAKSKHFSNGWKESDSRNKPDRGEDWKEKKKYNTVFVFPYLRRRRHKLVWWWCIILLQWCGKCFVTVVEKRFLERKIYFPFLISLFWEEKEGEDQTFSWDQLFVFKYIFFIFNNNKKYGPL